MEKFESFPEQPSKEQTDVLSSLKKVLQDMEERGQGEREKGVGDKKYEILYKIIKKLEEGGLFEELYSNLNDVEKHAIVTRLELADFNNELPCDYVDKFREELYGTIEDKEGKFINRKRQLELENKLQEAKRQD